MQKKYRKYFLLLISFVFYLTYGFKPIIILILSILINYIIGIWISKFKYKKILLFLGIALNLIMLIYFKYLNFFIQNLNSLFSLNFNIIDLMLPIGISFFTFQAISYLIDIYRKKITYEKNFFDFALYLIFFPKIISGPIIRYENFKQNLITLKNPTIDTIFYSIKRISFGLGKAVILAGVMGEIWSTIFSAISITDISIPTAWLGIICYSFQLYFDFSGYTDMAIGIANLFGFKIPENFDYPYFSTSISEFWRKWHISLSSWFKDYIYIPLGGNRKGNVFFNQWIVFILTGIWHGAGWCFLAWGIYNAIWMTIERLIRNNKYYNKIPKFIKIISTYLIVICGWVIFACNSFITSLNYFKYMVGIKNFGYEQFYFSYFFNKYTIFFLIISILCSSPLNKIIYSNIKNKNIYHILSGILTIFILIISIFFIINNTCNPPIYAQF